jgi:hypothetical protein
MKSPHLDETNIDVIDYKELKADETSKLALRTKEMHRTMTSCIIVEDKHSPKDLFLIAEPFLTQSCCSLAVHSRFIEPLSELEKHLSGIAVMVSIQELWTREHQVLPMRSHPVMLQEGAHSGFILTATTIVPGV